MVNLAFCSTHFQKCWILGKKSGAPSSVPSMPLPPSMISSTSSYLLRYRFPHLETVFVVLMWGGRVMKRRQEAGPHHLKALFQENQFLIWKVTKLPGVQSGLCVSVAPQHFTPPALNRMSSSSIPRITPTYSFNPINSLYILWPTSS